MKKIVVILIIAVAAASIFWFFYPLRSYVVMSVYSAQHSAKSVMENNGFSISMPSGKGWYPFVMTYNAEGFSNWSGIDADMSIMYNFGAFDAMTRTSSIYDTSSDQYSAFYGAYTVQKSGDEFGFLQSGEIDIDEVIQAVEYDYTQLVISDFGCDEITFHVDHHSTADNIEFAGSGGWVCLDAVITANGAAHHYDGYKTPYLQYGPPMAAVESDFDPLTLYGRVYMKFLEPYGCTVMAYVIAPRTETIEDCDSDILQKTRIFDN